MLKPIKTKKQYETALETIYNLLQKNLKPNSKDSDELEILSILVEKYEEKNYKIDLPDPVEAIKFRMDALGLSQNDLSEYMGFKSRVSEILNKKRKLSLPMIRTLNEKLNIPLETLVRDYKITEYK
ncbi:MAG: helix-turn-helix domain-containing protein [Ignavibacteria bacterium]|nr:helix-turn-helix domain-containing protein [Ignavibacteria bacterium]